MASIKIRRTVCVFDGSACAQTKVPDRARQSYSLQSM